MKDLKRSRIQKEILHKPWINILVLIFTSEFISAFIESVSFSFCNGFHSIFITSAWKRSKRCTLKDDLKNPAENSGSRRRDLPGSLMLEGCFIPWRCIFCQKFFHFKLKMSISQWLRIFKRVSLLRWFCFVPSFKFDVWGKPVVRKTIFQTSVFCVMCPRILVMSISLCVCVAQFCLFISRISNNNKLFLLEKCFGLFFFSSLKHFSQCGGYSQKKYLKSDLS